MIGWIIFVLFIAFLALILIRALLFRPEKTVRSEFEDVQFDEDAAIHALAELVRCKTVSYSDASLEDDAEFEKLIAKLPSLYPNVFRTCSLQRFDGRGLLFHWKGSDRSGDPAVLMAHYDVVPVDESSWDGPAFEAVIKDGAMWGRGTLDTKVTFNGILSAAENLISQGFTPKDDIYFAFSGGEEINGPGADNIVNYFESQGITPSMVVDEGGAVVTDIFPGVSGQCGLIGIAEKGLMNLEFDVSSDGGHASAPAPHTPVGILSKACSRLEDHPFKKHFEGPALEMFNVLGRHSTFLYRLIFANLWCFGGILDSICKKSGGELNALVRTTVAFTQMTGSAAPNVIPPSASMVANLRLNPADNVESAVEYVKNTIANDDIKLNVLIGRNPSPVSSIDCEGWRRVVSAVEGTWRGCIVAPYLMVQCSDSAYYGRISDRVYRFSAMDLTAEERHSIHGNNEHIRLETVKSAVEFFIRVMKQC